MWMCVPESVCVFFFFKHGGFKIAVGLCGLVHSTSIYLLGYFSATLSSTGRPESATHVSYIERNADKKLNIKSACAKSCVVFLMPRQVASMNMYTVTENMLKLCERKIVEESLHS